MTGKLRRQTGGGIESVAKRGVKVQSNLRKALSALILLLLIALAAFAQGAWGLGSYTFTSGNSSAPLQYSLANSSLASFGFVSGVGGVAFKGVAVPSADLSGIVPTLGYDRTITDGQRLEVHLGDKTVHADLPDWLMIPIARYADSQFDACVSLFGPRTTGTTYDIVYHEAFQNTLLGLRLLQADILLFDLEETWHLPRWNGNVVLGIGETAPERLDVTSARTIDTALSKGQFQSWVLTDDGESVVFDVDDKTLLLTGRPYYYFWTADMTGYERRIAPLEARAEELKRLGRIAEHNQIIDQINNIEPTVSNVTVLTERVKQARDALRGVNKPVYDAATNTMRYAAFFRFVKKKNPNGWRNFWDQIATVQIEPTISTPTRWSH